MSRSRMLGPDVPDGKEQASPKKTIVGGRPPEPAGDVPPVPTGIQRLLRLAAVDEAFRRTLLERRGEVAAAAGVALTDTERAVLAAIPADQIASMARNLPPPDPARREFLRATAASAVVLLGGALLPDCSGACVVRGMQSDVPPPVPVPPEQQETPPPRPDENLMQSEGGAAPHEPPPPRPDDNMMQRTGGAAPDEPPPPPPPSTPAGIRPDLPPERPRSSGGTTE